LFYANAPVVPTAADPALASKGKDLFAKLCVRCHGPQARGNEVYPRLAGQKQVYLNTSITRYRDNTGIRNNQLMSIATGGLKNEEILAISHYLTQLP
jgi:cytochrome c553